MIKMVSKRKLPKENLFEMFPYLKQELEYRSERKEGRGYAYGTNEWSELESAVLVEEQKKGFPNPFMGVTVDDYSTDINEVRVEFIDGKSKVVRTLKQGHYRTFPSSTSLSPDSSEGEITDKILKSAKRKPSFIIVKKIKTHKTYGGGDSEGHRYNIEVYKFA